MLQQQQQCRIIKYMSNKKIFEAARLMGANKYRLGWMKKDGKLLSTIFPEAIAAAEYNSYFPP